MCITTQNVKDLLPWMGHIIKRTRKNRHWGFILTTNWYGLLRTLIVLWVDGCTIVSPYKRGLIKILKGPVATGSPVPLVLYAITSQCWTKRLRWTCMRRPLYNLVMRKVTCDYLIANRFTNTRNKKECSLLNDPPPLPPSLSHILRLFSTNDCSVWHISSCPSPPVRQWWGSTRTPAGELGVV